MSATWEVRVPIAGYAVVSVTADSEADAEKKALEVVTLEHIEEWEGLRNIVRGNVFCGPLNSIEADEVPE